MLRAAVQAPTFAVEIDWAETARAAFRRFVKAALVFVGRLVVLSDLGIQPNGRKML